MPRVLGSRKKRGTAWRPFDRGRFPDSCTDAAMISSPSTVATSRRTESSFDFEDDDFESAPNPSCVGNQDTATTEGTAAILRPFSKVVHSTFKGDGPETTLDSKMIEEAGIRRQAEDHGRAAQDGDPRDMVVSKELRIDSALGRNSDKSMRVSTRGPMQDSLELAQLKAQFMVERERFERRFQDMNEAFAEKLKRSEDRIQQLNQDSKESLERSKRVIQELNEQSSKYRERSERTIQDLTENIERVAASVEKSSARSDTDLKERDARAAAERHLFSRISGLEDATGGLSKEAARQAGQVKHLESEVNAKQQSIEQLVPNNRRLLEVQQSQDERMNSLEQRLSQSIKLNQRLQSMLDAQELKSTAEMDSINRKLGVVSKAIRAKETRINDLEKYLELSVQKTLKLQTTLEHQVRTCTSARHAKKRSLDVPLKEQATQPEKRTAGFRRKTNGGPREWLDRFQTTPRPVSSNQSGQASSGEKRHTH
jgi:hypothetical protein